MLAVRYFITFYSFSYTCICGFLPISISLTYFIYCFPCSPYQRGWDCAAWWVSPCVGVSLCVDVRLSRVSSCAWPVGDALVNRGLAYGV